MRGAGNMLRSLYVPLVVIASFSLSPAAHAQTSEGVVRGIFASIDSSDWSGAVSLVHPEALRLFHVEQVRLARVEEAARSDPRIAAEFRDSKPVYQRVYGVESADQLDAMPSAVMLAHYLRKRNPHVAHSPVTEPGVSTPVWSPSLRIIGAVADGDSVEYVVFTWSANIGKQSDSPLAVESNQAKVMTLKRDSGKWKVMLDGGVVWGSGGLLAFGEETK